MWLPSEPLWHHGTGKCLWGSQEKLQEKPWVWHPAPKTPTGKALAEFGAFDPTQLLGSGSHRCWDSVGRMCVVNQCIPVHPSCWGWMHSPFHRASRGRGDTQAQGWDSEPSWEQVIFWEVSGWTPCTEHSQQISPPSVMVPGCPILKIWSLGQCPCPQSHQSSRVGSGVTPVCPPHARRGVAVCLRCAPLQPAQLHGQGVLRQQEEGGGNHHPAPGLPLPEHPGAVQHARDGAVRHEVLQIPHVQRRAGDLPARYRGSGGVLPTWLEVWWGLRVVSVLTQHLQRLQGVLRCPFCAELPSMGLIPTQGHSPFPRSKPKPQTSTLPGPPSFIHPSFPPPRRRCPGENTFPTQPPPDDLRPAALPPRPRGSHGAFLLEGGPAAPQAQRLWGHRPHAEGIHGGGQHLRGG